MTAWEFIVHQRRLPRKGRPALALNEAEPGRKDRCGNGLPGVRHWGIIGGSQREDNYDLLKARIEELGMRETDYALYLDLRKYGSARHAGFGLGFEYCVMYRPAFPTSATPFPSPEPWATASCK